MFVPERGVTKRVSTFTHLVQRLHLGTEIVAEIRRFGRGHESKQRKGGERRSDGSRFHVLIPQKISLAPNKLMSSRGRMFRCD